MTTDPQNTITRSGLKLHPEHAVSDTNHSSRVIHGDCLQALRQLPENSVDFVLTDPPYLVRYRDRTGRRVANDDNDRWLYRAFAEMYRVLKPDSYCVSFYGWPKADRFLAAWRACGFYPVGHFVWVKSYASGVRHTQSRHEQAYLLAKGYPKRPVSPPPDVLSFQFTGNQHHPTQKPVEALLPLIRAYSPKGGTVLDPFAGSGATGLAAKACGCEYLLIEKDPQHAATARRRLAS